MNKEISDNLKETELILQDINNTDSLEFSKWTKDKTILRYHSKLPTFPIYNNFIYWCNLGINIGSEQNKLRPVIVLKSYSTSPICTILPLTSKRLNDNYWYHIDLNKIDSTVLVEQLRVISKVRFVKPYRKKGTMVTISINDWYKINEQLKKMYILRPLENKH
ncbi:MAG: type II toxin-antitoxin system PemK/MazF family toxin [Clostridia bacterium]|nr:type II toxin-antitoxin system PemK/MazF family toxin [Clostridia bacterium]